jgi:hypothetical protein
VRRNAELLLPEHVENLTPIAEMDDDGLSGAQLSLVASMNESVEFVEGADRTLPSDYKIVKKNSKKNKNSRRRKNALSGEMEELLSAGSESDSGVGSSDDYSDVTDADLPKREIVSRSAIALSAEDTQLIQADLLMFVAEMESKDNSTSTKTFRRKNAVSGEMEILMIFDDNDIANKNFNLDGKTIRRKNALTGKEETVVFVHEEKVSRRKNAISGLHELIFSLDKCEEQLPISFVNSERDDVGDNQTIGTHDENSFDIRAHENIEKPLKIEEDKNHESVLASDGSDNGNTKIECLETEVSKVIRIDDEHRSQSGGGNVTTQQSVFTVGKAMDAKAYLCEELQKKNSEITELKNLLAKKKLRDELQDKNDEIDKLKQLLALAAEAKAYVNEKNSDNVGTTPPESTCEIMLGSQVLHVNENLTQGNESESNSMSVDPVGKVDTDFTTAASVKKNKFKKEKFKKRKNALTTAEGVAALDNDSDSDLSGDSEGMELKLNSMLPPMSTEQDVRYGCLEGDIRHEQLTTGRHDANITSGQADGLKSTDIEEDAKNYRIDGISDNVVDGTVSAEGTQHKNFQTSTAINDDVRDQSCDADDYPNYSRRDSQYLDVANFQSKECSASNLEQNVIPGQDVEKVANVGKNSHSSSKKRKKKPLANDILRRNALVPNEESVSDSDIDDCTSNSLLQCGYGEADISHNIDDMNSNDVQEIIEEIGVQPASRRVGPSFVDKLYEKYPIVIQDATHGQHTMKSELKKSQHSYNDVLSDINNYEAKNRYKGKPKLPTELNTIFSAIPDDDKLKILLKLTDETLHDKVQNLPDIVDRKEPTFIKGTSKEKPLFEIPPPDDSKLLYATTNSNYRGLYSDSMRMMQYSRVQHPTDEKFNWKSIDHVDVNGNEDNLKSQARAVKNAMDNFEKNITRKELKNKK